MKKVQYSAPTVSFVKRGRPINQNKIIPKSSSNKADEFSQSRRVPSIKSPILSETVISMGIDEHSFLTHPSYLFNSSNQDDKANPVSSKPSRKKIIIWVTVLLSVACVLIILASVLAVVIPNKGNNAHTSTDSVAKKCSHVQTCIGSETQYPITSNAILYTFDGNTRDASGLANGSPVGTYTLPSYYYGGFSGYTITLNASQQQYVNIPFIDFRNTSFTIELWLLPISVGAGSGLPDDFPIFGQCDASLTCLLLTFRSGHIQLSFDSMGTNTTLISSSLLVNGYWVHVAIVYDITTYQQLIYVNGIIDAVSQGTTMPFQGSSSGAVTTIGLGRSAAFSVTSFSGHIDQVLISRNLAKSACEIYNDALLVAYFPFDTNGTLNDHSAALNPGMSLGTSLVTGYVHEALLFSATSSSFFQSACFPNLRRTTVFTLLLWVNPTNVTGGGTIVHMSSDQTGNGSVCYDLIGMTSNGTLVAQIAQNSTLTTAVSGPMLLPNVWTHLAVMYSSRNGMRFYVNGTLRSAQPNVANSLPFWYLNTGQYYVTLGNSQPTGASSPTCQKSSLPIISSPFSGAIDEFRLYMAELNGEEICVIANP